MVFERPAIIRPPSEWKSYFLPVTSGCSNNTCTFCNFFGAKLAIRDVVEVKAEIDALDLYARHGLRLPSVNPIVYEIAPNLASKRVFLQDGDALAYPFPRLLEVMQYLDQKFPDLERVGAYATPQDLLRRTAGELEALRELKLTMLYMGIESGDDVVLARVQKGATHDQIVEAGRKARAAGISLSVTVILGLGSVEGSDRHAVETARILGEIDPEFGGALTLTLVPGTPLHREAEEGTFQLVSPFQSLRELKLLVSHLEVTNCFFSSMHASNYVSVRGLLPRQKKEMVAQLEEVLSKNDPSLLRPEFLRGL